MNKKTVSRMRHLGARPCPVGAVLLFCLALLATPTASTADPGSEALLPTHKFRPAAVDGIQGEYLVALGQDDLEKSGRGFSKTVVLDRAEQLRQEYGFVVLDRWNRIVPMLLVRTDPETARFLSADPRVTLVEQHRRFELDRPTPGETFSELGERAGAEKVVCSTPSSPQAITGCPNPGPTGCFDNWGLDRIDALPGQPFDGSYSWETTGFGVHVYVFDRGLQDDHCEYEVPEGSEGDLEDHSHGTRVSSIIAGRSIGVAKDAIVHERVLSTSNTRAVLDRFEDIVRHIEQHNIGVAVINASWNIPKLADDPVFAPDVVPGAVSLMARTLVEEHGVTLVVSAGNRETSPLDFTPSDLGYVEGVIVVGGTDANDQRWRRNPNDPLCASGGTNEGDCGSNFGPGVDLWAPADWIYGATMDGGASTLSGTSFAAPHVTGAVARLLQFDPDLSPKQVERFLKYLALPGEVGDIGEAPNLLLNVASLPTVASAAPVVRPDFGRTVVDAPTTIDVLYNDLDRDGNFLEVVSVGSPGNGAAVIVGDKVRYTPANDFDGTDSFSYTVSDGTLTSTASVTVVVEPDLPPVAVPDHEVFDVSGWQPSLGPFVFRDNLSLNDIDPFGSTPQYLTHGPIDGGQLDRVQIVGGQGNNYEFTPDLVDFGPNHTYRFDLTVIDQFDGDDGVDHTDTATVFLTTYTQGTGDPPVAALDEIYTEPGVVVSSNVLANDDGPVTLGSIQSASGESVACDNDPATTLASRLGTVDCSANGTVTFDPDPGVSGWDGFAYLATDGNGNLAAESVVVQVGGNRPPQTFDRASKAVIGESCFLSFQCLMGLTHCWCVGTTSSGKDAEDPDGDPISVSSWSQPTAGSLTESGSGVTFTPPNGFEGYSVFTYTVTDGRGGFDSAQVTIQVGEPTGDFDDGDDGHPVGEPNVVVIPAGSSSHLIFDHVLLNGDTDPDEDTLRICGYLDSAAHGDLDTTPLIGVEYEPDASFWIAGSDTFYYRLSDRATCDRTFPVRVTVIAGSATNNPPVGVPDVLEVPTGETSFSISLGAMLGNDSDPDGDDLRICGYVDQTQYGFFQPHVVGATYQPGPEFWLFGEDHYQYLLSDRADCSTTYAIDVTLVAEEIDGIAAADSFDGGSGVLNGRVTEIGGRTWSARSELVLSGDVVTATDWIAVGGVPIDPAEFPSGVVFSVRAKIDPTGADWVAVGFSESDQGAYSFDGQIWALIRSNGFFNLYADGQNQLLAQGLIPGSPVAGFHDVEVSFDSLTGLVRVAINGIPVLRPTLLDNAPTITHAGFHMRSGSQGVTRFDDFEVRVRSSDAVIWDDFTTTVFTGTAVEGRHVSVGDVVWRARQDAQIADGTVIARGPVAIAGVPVDVDALDPDETIIVSAEVDPSGSDWSAVGFTSAASNPFWDNGELWVLLRPNGSFKIHSQGAAAPLGNGAIPGLPVAGLHQVEVRYQPSMLEASVWINGIEVLAPTVLGFVPDITHAGFHLRIGTPNVTALDNFLVSIED